MNRRFRTVPRALVALAIVACFSPAMLAGPPLVCWKVDTAGASSLPWTDNPRSYEGMRSDYGTAELAQDTLSLLTPDTPVLARMETLRRAALYATKDPKAGEELLSRLVSRAKDSESRGSADPLAFFDAGYLVEALKQADGAHEPAFWSRMLVTLGLRRDRETTLGGPTGYEWVRKAIKLGSENAEMEYAAALVTWHPRRPEHEGHLALAAAGATEGTPLARNLLQHFGDRGRTLAELRASTSLAMK